MRLGSHPGWLPARASTAARSCIAGLGLAGLLAMGACGHKPPYSRADQPSAQELLATTAPQLEALAVSDANVTINRIAKADLAMLAEAPNRFRGSVTKAGNELVELAFHEDGYALRYKLDQLPAGFYHGPPDPCAVEAMLSVPLSYEGLVALVLGGAPTLAEPYEVLDQRWDRRGGHEELVIANAGFVEELRFGLHGGVWRFTGAAMWVRTGGGDKGRRLWDLEHDRFKTVGPAVLPSRTRIRAPAKRRDSFVVIEYSGRDPSPPWAGQTSVTPADDDASTDDGAPDPTEGWGDDDGWEDGESGWEDGESEQDGGPDAAASPAPPREQLGRTARAGEPAAAPAQPAAVPGIFVIGGSGLVDRGDLCR